MNWKSLLLLVLLIPFFKGSLNAQRETERCNLILQNGLYKTFKITRQTTFNQDIKTYFSSDEFRKDYKEGKWGGFLSIFADALPIKLGASASETEISEFQKSVREATSIRIDQSFYDYAYTAIPDVELAKAYTECIAVSRRYGFLVNAVVNEKDVLFIISYENQVKSDPMPVVTRFEIRNGNNVTKSFNVGDKLKAETSISSDRDPEKDMTLILETDRGVATYKVPAEPTGFNKDFPVGTVISSYLSWSEFQTVTRNNDNNPVAKIWSSRYSKWAPADGRQVPNSAFERITNQNTLPDLRGAFLRGLNQFDHDQSSFVSSERKDPDNRIRGSFQPDDFKSHDHEASGKITGNITGSNNTNDVDQGSQKKNSDPNFPDRNVAVTVQKRGGDETRPKNVAILYYIRIN